MSAKSPYHHHVGRPNGHHRFRPREDIEIEIMSHTQSERWDATTAVTSDRSESVVDLSHIVNKEDDYHERDVMFKCQMWTGTVVAGVLSVCAFLSPIIMIILPKIEALEWKVAECGPECDGLLISFAFKLLILLICTWAVFVRRPRATMPRIFVYRSVILALIFIFMVSYWLFFAVRIAERRFAEYELSYQSVVMFALSLVDAMLYIHYLAVILIEIRHLQPQLHVKVVRSPDGHSRYYNIGQLSIQRAAVWILERYYQDFPIYNPHLDVVPSKARSGRDHRDRSTEKRHKGTIISNGNGNDPGSVLSPAPVLKYYDVEGISTSTPNGFGSRAVPGQPGFGYASVNMNSLSRSHAPGMDNNAGNQTMLGGELEKNTSANAASTGGRRNRHRHHNDKFYEEHEYERRVKKRRARLLTAAEEAFTHIRRVGENEQGPAIPMDPHESAQAIFPSMARALQKYLRVTRQQTRHTMQSILEHLSKQLTFDMSAKAFLEKYLVTTPVFQNDQEHKPVQTWGLVCETLLSREIYENCSFMLRQDDVSLLVTVSSMPHFSIREEIIDPKCNRFVFRLNSETSV